MFPVFGETMSVIELLNVIWKTIRECQSCRREHRSRMVTKCDGRTISGRKSMSGFSWDFIHNLTMYTDHWRHRFLFLLNFRIYLLYKILFRITTYVISSNKQIIRIQSSCSECTIQPIKNYWVVLKKHPLDFRLLLCDITKFAVDSKWLMHFNIA